METQFYWLVLYSLHFCYVPEVVWGSKSFWIVLVVMVVGIYFYQNYILKKNSLLGKSFNLQTENGNPTAAIIQYSSEGRSGHVHFQNAEAKFALYYEFGGGDCVVTIDIPSSENWEKQTRLPLSRRDEVLNLIGRQVVKDQTTEGRGSFKIEGNWLNIYA